MLYIVRHGETVWNKEGKIQGQCDSPLTSKGIEQAKHYSKILTYHVMKDHNIGDFDFVVSPLQRTQHTAKIILDSLGLKKKIVLEPLAKEKNNGIWEGKHYTIFEEHYSKQQDKWNYQHKDEESQEIFYNRVNKLLTKYKNKKTILVTHGGVSLYLRAIITRTNKNFDEMVSQHGWQRQDEIFHVKNNVDVIKLKI
ncbi:histidine phosphatase family protein [Pseudomonadota bacterium]